MSRRKGRVLAFQALYSWDMGGMQEADLMRFDWAQNERGESVDSESKLFASLLLGGTIEHIKEIDSQIKMHLSDKWKFNRLNKVTLAILRMSIYPILFQKDMPATVVIDEAVAIARSFGPDDSFKFINALLDAVRRDTSEMAKGLA